VFSFYASRASGEDDEMNGIGNATTGGGENGTQAVSRLTQTRPPVFQPQLNSFYSYVFSF